MVDVTSEIRYYIIDEQIADKCQSTFSCNTPVNDYDVGVFDSLRALTRLAALSQATAVTLDQIHFFLDPDYTRINRTYLAGSKKFIQKGLAKLTQEQIVGITYYTEHIDPQLEALRALAVEASRPSITATGLSVNSQLSQPLSEFLIAGGFLIIRKFELIGGSRIENQYGGWVKHITTNTEWEVEIEELIDEQVRVEKQVNDGGDFMSFVDLLPDRALAVIDAFDADNTFNLSASGGIDASIKINALRASGRI